MRLWERPSGQSWRNPVRDRQGPCSMHRPLVLFGTPTDSDKSCTGQRWTGVPVCLPRLDMPVPFAW